MVQELVRKAVEELVESGRELGVQVAAYLHGEQIVDVCAGVADPDTGRPVTPDTPFFSVSTGKGMTATVVHVLAEQGRLDYDLRIADVWPEYGRHGKEATTLRHVLTHSAGVPALPADITPEDFTDWDRMCALLADQRPLWTPGTRSGYHAWTYGWLVGEVVRRVSGQPISTVLAEQVAAPLGVPGELFFGVPEHDLDRLARLVDRNLAAAMETYSTIIPNFDRIAPRAVRPGVELGNRRDFLRADVPATGTLTARAAARMLAALIGEVDGVRLVSPGRLRAMTTVVDNGPDWAFGQVAPMGLGYAVEPDGAFGTAGNGGSLAFAYPDRGLTLAATKNYLGAGDDDPMEDLRTLIRDAIT
jgi:CubicO group peptidase (beta-lactamase class C family)